MNFYSVSFFLAHLKLELLTQLLSLNEWENA